MNDKQSRVGWRVYAALPAGVVTGLLWLRLSGILASLFLELSGYFPRLSALWGVAAVALAVCGAMLAVLGLLARDDWFREEVRKLGQDCRPWVSAVLWGWDFYREILVSLVLLSWLTILAIGIRVLVTRAEGDLTVQAFLVVFFSLCLGGLPIFIYLVFLWDDLVDMVREGARELKSLASPPDLSQKRIKTHWKGWTMKVFGKRLKVGWALAILGSTMVGALVMYLVHWWWGESLPTAMVAVIYLVVCGVPVYLLLGILQDLARRVESLEREREE